MKSLFAEKIIKFQDIPNVGPAMIADFKLLNIMDPSELKSRDALSMYQDLCKITGTRHDPCVLDTFLAVVDFMKGAPSYPWWYYTSDRKKLFPDL